MGWPKGKSRKVPYSRDDSPIDVNKPMELVEVNEPEAMTREEVIARAMASEPVAVANYDDITPHCGICRFWHPTGELLHGQCRRFPAHPRNNSPYANWPVMTATDWCGEFKAKD